MTNRVVYKAAASDTEAAALYIKCKKFCPRPFKAQKTTHFL